MKFVTIFSFVVSALSFVACGPTANTNQTASVTSNLADNDEGVA